MECPNAARLWQDIKNIINQDVIKTNFSEENIMFLTEENKAVSVDIRNIIITVKWIIWKVRCIARYQDHATISYNHYKLFLKHELKETRTITKDDKYPRPKHNKTHKKSNFKVICHFTSKDQGHSDMKFAPCTSTNPD